MNLINYLSSKENAKMITWLNFDRDSYVFKLDDLFDIISLDQVELTYISFIDVSNHWTIIRGIIFLFLLFDYYFQIFLTQKIRTHNLRDWYRLTYFITIKFPLDPHHFNPMPEITLIDKSASLDIFTIKILWSQWLGSLWHDCVEWLLDFSLLWSLLCPLLY